MRIISFVANILAISVATFGATMIAQIFISRGLYYFFDGLPLDAKFIWLRYDAMCTVLAMCFTLACHRRRPMAMREHCTCTMIGKVGIFLTLNMASPYTNGLLLADWKIAFIVLCQAHDCADPKAQKDVLALAPDQHLGLFYAWQRAFCPHGRGLGTQGLGACKIQTAVLYIVYAY
jgi:hypothetical protein